MTIRLGLLVGMLAVGMTVLPPNSYGFDGASQRASAYCAAKRVDSCAGGPVTPKEAEVLPGDFTGPLPLPRPPDLGTMARERPASFCSHSEACR